MGIKGHDRRQRAALKRQGLHFAQHLLMTEVQAVKDAHGNDTRLVARSSLAFAENNHRRQPNPLSPTPPPAAPIPVSTARPGDGESPPTHLERSGPRFRSPRKCPPTQCAGPFEVDALDRRSPRRWATG